MTNRESMRTNRIVMRIAAGMLSAIVVGVVAGCNALKPESAKKVNTDSSIGLASAIASLEFDKTSGKLIRFTSAADQSAFLNPGVGKGNLFRIYFGVKPLEDKPVGGDYLDAGEFLLHEYRFQRHNHQPALMLTYAGKKGDASLEVVLDVVATESGAFDLTLSVKNTSATPQTVMVDFPYVSGVKLGDDPRSDLSIYMNYAGASGAPAWKDLSNRYVDMPNRGKWSFAFDIVYNKDNTRTFGYMILDKHFGSKTFKREAVAQAMKTSHIPAVMLAPGTAHAWPPARLMALTGSWKVIAREYGNWFRANFTVPVQPQWYKDTDDFHSMSAPDWSGHTGYRPYTELAESRNHFFDRFVADTYLNREVASQELHGWHNWGSDSGQEYDVRPDLGGNDKLKAAFVLTHNIGRHINSYFGASTGVFDLVEPGKPRSYFEVVYQDGGHFRAYPFEEHHPRFGLRQATICPGLDSWRQYIVRETKKVLELGFDGFRLDEQPFTLDCFNPEHHHQNPYDGCYRVAELMRVVREEFDRVKPGTVIMSEWGTDFQVPYINSAMIHSHAGFAVTPARVAFPELYWLPHYPLGAFECALNGWMVQEDGACTLGEAQDRAPNMPWPNKARFAQLNNHGPVTQWRNLRSQFRDALVSGDTSDIEPFCPDDEFWRGTLFKSKDYYLLVGGYPDGTSLLGPRRIKLDFLPRNIASAYEIDAYTLAKWPAQIERTASGIFVTVKSGFSAVLLPAPFCPPKIEASVFGDAISVSTFSPWRKDRQSRNYEAAIEVPGLDLPSPVKVTLPATIKFKKPSDAKPGKYYFMVRGTQTLPYRGWFDVK